MGQPVAVVAVLTVAEADVPRQGNVAHRRRVGLVGELRPDRGEDAADGNISSTANKHAGDRRNGTRNALSYVRRSDKPKNPNAHTSTTNRKSARRTRVP